MKRSIGLWQFFGFAVTSLLGTLLHFLYDWLGGVIWIAPFSGVNESTWEHMKLLFWPLILFAIVQSFFFHDRRDFWCVKAKGILLGLFLIPLVFYTYNGAIGPSPDWLNITLFFICASAAFLYEARQFKKETISCSHKLSLSLLVLLALLFVTFTFRTPELSLFQDPLSGRYGI